MARANRVLFVTQEMVPYVEESLVANYGRFLSQKTQEDNREIRSFMPKWGGINERRNQLHEVIRLSGMNMIMDGTDHPLIIKVASITAARMQIYFIDNDDFFGKRLKARDANGEEYTDNTERAIFYARGVLETVKKLKWTPNVIHCQGWISSIVPLYVKKAYQEEPSFRDCKIIFTPTEPDLNAPIPENLADWFNFRGASVSDFEGIEGNMDIQTLNRLGMKYADGVALMEENEDFRAFAQSLNKPLLDPTSIDDAPAASIEFYDQILSK